LANHKSAIKRAKQNEKRRLRNKAVKTETKKAVKRVRLVVAENEKDAAVEQLNTAKSIIAKAAKKGVLHRNTAARKISRLQAGVNSIS
jgi:small subunit ribosomal protein S20